LRAGAPPAVRLNGMRPTMMPGAKVAMLALESTCSAFDRLKKEKVDEDL
jgi:hypothetical protein